MDLRNYEHHYGVTLCIMIRGIAYITIPCFFVRPSKSIRQSFVDPSN